jgi:glycosyltransferase involved in cell wall biosynthesis
MNACKLGVVIPTIGRAVLDETIASAAEQTVPFDEIVVFDNSKTQDIRQRSRFAADPRIIWRQSGGQLDIIGSWNTAMAAVTADYIHMLGDDDLLRPEFSERVRAFLPRTDGMLIVPWGEIDAGGRIVAEFSKPWLFPASDCYTGRQYRELLMSNRAQIRMSSLIFARRHFEAFGGFKRLVQKGLFMDQLLHIELTFFCERIVLVPEILWYYRQEAGDWSGRIADNAARRRLFDELNAYVGYLAETYRRADRPEAAVFPGGRAAFARRLFFGMTPLTFGDNATLVWLFEYLRRNPGFSWRDRLYIFRKYFLQCLKRSF